MTQNNEFFININKLSLKLEIIFPLNDKLSQIILLKILSITISSNYFDFFGKLSSSKIKNLAKSTKENLNLVKNKQIWKIRDLLYIIYTLIVLNKYILLTQKRPELIEVLSSQSFNNLNKRFLSVSSKFLQRGVAGRTTTFSRSTKSYRYFYTKK